MEGDRERKRGREGEGLSSRVSGSEVEMKMRWKQGICGSDRNGETSGEG